MTSTRSADPVHTLFPEAQCLGSTAWSVALQNGHHHQTRVVFRDGLVILTAPLEGARRSARQLAQINPSLPSGCRILCSVNGVWLATELAKDRVLPSALTRAVHLFQQGLDVVCGAVGTVSADNKPRPEWLTEGLDANSDWQLTEAPDGTMTARLPHKKGSLPLTVSVTGTVVQVLGSGNHPSSVREAVAEVLLRATAKVRFVRACAEESSDGRWTAWLDVPPLICSIDDALTALALVCRDCGAEAGALGDPALASLYCEISSVWRAFGPPTLEERR
jgi:hypothetical protein